MIGLVDFAGIRERRSWFLALGVGLIVVGALAILLPFVASLATTIVVGWLMIVGGLFQGIHAFQNRRWAASGWAIAGAVLLVIAGALLVAFPVVGTLTVTLVLAAFFFATGALKIVRALQHRAMSAWGWLFVDGLVSLALGVMIWAGWPSTAAWALGLLVGIDLVFSGTSMLVIGLAAGSLARPRA